MPPMGGRNVGLVKPKNTKKSISRILGYIGRSKFLLIIVFLTLILSTLCQTGAS